MTAAATASPPPAPPSRQRHVTRSSAQSRSFRQSPNWQGNETPAAPLLISFLLVSIGIRLNVCLFAVTHSERESDDRSSEQRAERNQPADLLHGNCGGEVVLFFAANFLNNKSSFPEAGITALRNNDGDFLLSPFSSLNNNSFIIVNNSSSFPVFLLANKTHLHCSSCTCNISFSRGLLISSTSAWSADGRRELRRGTRERADAERKDSGGVVRQSAVCE